MNYGQTDKVDQLGYQYDQSKPLENVYDTNSKS